MKKVEGILTVFGVAIILGMPIFLMFYDVIKAPQENNDSLIKISAYEENNRATVVLPNESQEKEVIKVDNYIQEYEVLDKEVEIVEEKIEHASEVIEIPQEDALETETINTMIKEKFEEIVDQEVPLGLEENVVIDDVQENDIVILEQEIFEEEKAVVLPTFEEVIALDDEDIIVDELEIKELENVIIHENFFLEDENTPESIDEMIDIKNEETKNDEMIVTDSTEVIVDDSNVLECEIAPETFYEEITEEVISQSIIASEDTYEFDEIKDELEVIEDDEIPEALREIEGYETMEVKKLEGDFNVYEVTLTYNVLNEDGTSSINTVTFLY